MKNGIPLNITRTIIAACFLLLLLHQKSISQCTSALPGMTVNGVTISGQGNLSFFGGPETACGYTSPANSLYMTNFNGNGNYLYDFYFSKPVNNIRIIVTGRSFDTFDFYSTTFVTNNGAPTLTKIGSCTIDVSTNYKNVLVSRTINDNPVGGGEFIISVEGGFTNLNIRNRGGGLARLAICAESIIPCPDVPVLSAITQPACNNLAGSFNITNFNSANNYAVSPAANTSISSTGEVVVPADGSYTVTAANATCTSKTSAPAVVNNLICAGADEYTITTNQTLTENLQANDSYIPAGTVYYIPRPDPAFTNPSACVPLVVNNSPEERILTFNCGTAGIYHFLVPVAVGQTRVQVPLTITVTAPLPVMLISFNAIKEKQSVNLDWETTEETNSDRFEIEWGTDGKQWSKIGSVSANGESRQLVKYKFEHTQPWPGQNLYRLKMIDKDLTYTFSAIRNVNMSGTEGNVVYPNPVLDGKIQIRNWTNIRAIELYNQQGQMLKSFQPAEKEKMDVSKLEAGFYVIRLIRTDGSSESQKVMITK